MNKNGLWGICIATLYFWTGSEAVLPQGFHINGRVITQAGQPAAKAQMEFVSETEPAVTFATTTNFSGEYEIHIDLETSADNQSHQENLPSEFKLSQNYPNPIAHSTTIPFTLNQPGHVTLFIYNLVGQRVRTLVDEFKSSGTHHVKWDGSQTDGNRLPAGIYFCHIVSMGKIQTRKMLLLEKGSFYSAPNAAPVVLHPSLAKFSGGSYFSVRITGPEVKSYKQTGIYIDTDQQLDFQVSENVHIFDVAAAGGTFAETDPNSELYGFKVEIPQDAVANRMRIEISTAAEPLKEPDQNLQCAGKLIRMTASETTFNVPVLVSYPVHNIADKNRDGMFIGLYANDIKKWDYPGILQNDVVNEEIVFITNHIGDIIGLVAGGSTSDLACDPEFIFPYPYGEYWENKYNWDVFPINNFGEPRLFWTAGHSGGIVLFTKWYFQNMQNDHPLYRAFSNPTAEKIARLAQTQSENFGNTIKEFWRKLAPTASVKSTINSLYYAFINSNNPQILLMSSLGGEFHTVLVYEIKSEDAENFTLKVYNPDDNSAASFIRIQDGTWINKWMVGEVQMEYLIYPGERTFDELINQMPDVFASLHAVITPAAPTGPVEAQAGQTMTVSTTPTICTQGHDDIQYRFYWLSEQGTGGGYSDWGSPSQQISIDAPNNYRIWVNARCRASEVVSSEKSASIQCSIHENSSETGTVTDIDGNVYQTIKIGNQWWMAENVKVTHYRNGDPIPRVMDKNEWDNLMTGAWCEYNNDPANAGTYGLLYNWYAVNDRRNVAPAGWHVPTDEEWKQLEMYLGMRRSQADGTGWRGSNEGGKMKEAGTTHWNSPNTGATNESGFSALPGGYRFHDATFYGLGYLATFWSLTETESRRAWPRNLYHNASYVYRDNFNEGDGFSLRCVKDSDDSHETGFVTDIDNNVYKIIKIGEQWWMAENLKVTHYRNAEPIENVTGNNQWANLDSSAWCVYRNDLSYNDAYGLLYNWYAVNDSRNIAPEGWHVPTDEEWKQLEMALGMSRAEADGTDYRGTNEGSKLAWNALLWATGALENNPEFGKSGFSALPGGYRYSYGGYFYDIFFSAYFWSSTESSSSDAWHHHLSYYFSTVRRYDDDKLNGFSVRCVKD